jgi:hypothetical protein
MKQYLNKEQTAKLMELGFPRPQHAIPIRQEGQDLIHDLRYCIGELIEFLPGEITNESNETKWLEFNKSEVYYTDFVTTSYYKSSAELIDALFNVCVTLKEEGLI